MISSLIRRLMVVAALASAVSSAGPAIAQQTSDTPVASAGEKIDVVWNAIDGFIRPGYTALHDRAMEEARAVGDLCSEPSSGRLANARDGFAELAKAWSRVEFVQFGPVVEDNRSAKILFFPDRRGIALRQIQGILADKDDSAASVDGLSQKSVAVQGLIALEFVLYGDGADTLSKEKNGFRCRYGAAIADNLQKVSAAIEDGWADENGIVERLTEPNSTDPAYRSADDSLKEIAEIFIRGFETLRDVRLTPSMGENASSAKPNLFLFHRADLTLASLRANFAGMKSLFEESAITSLLPEESAYLADAIGFEFENADRTLANLASPLSDVVSGEKGRQSLTYLLIVTDSLQKQFAGQLSPTLGLSAGFSSLDGD